MSDWVSNINVSSFYPDFTLKTYFLTTSWVTILQTVFKFCHNTEFHVTLSNISRSPQPMLVFLFPGGLSFNLKRGGWVTSLLVGIRYRELSRSNRLSWWQMKVVRLVRLRWLGTGRDVREPGLWPWWCVQLVPGPPGRRRTITTPSCLHNCPPPAPPCILV